MTAPAAPVALPFDGDVDDADDDDDDDDDGGDDDYQKPLIGALF